VPARALRVVVPSDDAAHFEAVRDSLQRAVVPPGWSLRVEQVQEASRLRAYQDWRRTAGGETLLVLHKNARIANPAFFLALGRALEVADVVSFAGGRRWTRVDWRLDDFETKAGAFISRSPENASMAELHVVGHGSDALHTGLQVLDGTVLAIAPGAADLPWDEDLLGCETLLEEVWTHQAAQAGVRLAAHRGLGVFIDPAIPLDGSNHTEARVHCAELLGLDPFTHVREDSMALSVPVPDAAAAVAVTERYLENPA
jgi:protein O-GlcNAc transferase